MKSRACLLGSAFSLFVGWSISAATAQTGLSTQTAAGHAIGIGPNSPGGSGSFAPSSGAGTPNATGGPLPRGPSALKPNTGAGKTNGSKGAPMMANGVRKIN